MQIEFETKIRLFAADKLAQTRVEIEKLLEFNPLSKKRNSREFYDPSIFVEILKNLVLSNTAISIGEHNFFPPLKIWSRIWRIVSNLSNVDFENYQGERVTVDVKNLAQKIKIAEDLLSREHGSFSKISQVVLKAAVFFASFSQSLAKKDPVYDLLRMFKKINSLKSNTLEQIVDEIEKKGS